MADLTITAASVKYVRGNRPSTRPAGATIARGKVLRRGTSQEYILASALNAPADLANFAGIAISDGYLGGDVLIAGPGTTINVGATTAAGVPYVISETAGGIAPFADLGADSTATPVFLFWGNGTAEVTIGELAGTVVIPTP